jgi:hypothetical protein
MRVKRSKIVSWAVQEYLGRRAGVAKGKRTGVYGSEAEAIMAMAKARAAGNGASCIARNRDGASVCLVLGLVRW